MAAAAALTPLPAHAADKSLAAQLKQLQQRMQQLEQRNQALEQQVQELRSAKPVAAAADAPTPASNAAAASSASTDDDAASAQAGKPDRGAQPPQEAAAAPPDAAPAAEGPSVETKLTAVAQHVNSAGAGQRQGRISYRGDVVVKLPAGEIGAARGLAVGHLRFGQGNGVAMRPTYTGAVNSTAFEASAGSAQTYAIVAEAYYQLEHALGSDRLNRDRGDKNDKGDRLELTIGKIDLFGFFDQNVVASDEATQFLNNVFVHNPLLDSGGDIAADAYGFAPGARAAYYAVRERFNWGASLGLFASGAGATFTAGPRQPLVIAQLEASPTADGEPAGNYRLYAWTNGRTRNLDDQPQRHSGIGLSVDQRVGDEANLFARLGRRTRGDGKFDSAVTFGFERGGKAWGRGADAIGVAVGWLKTGSAWRTATADGSRVGYAAGGAERIAELYYRMRLNQHLDITPDLQFIQRAGGNGDAPMVHVLGVRATLGF